MTQTKNKTDKLDARNLARSAQTGWYTPVHRKSATAQLPRTQLQARTSLLDTAKAQAARVRGLLRAHGVKVGPISSWRFVAHVTKLAADQMPAWTTTLAPLIHIYMHAQEATKAAARQVTQQSRQDPLCQQLMQVPWVGPLVASTFVATLDDPNRFATSRQVTTYLGSVPRVYQSGTTNYHGRIRKEDEKLLRWLLVAAHVLLTGTRRSCTLKRGAAEVGQEARTGKS